MYGYLTDNCMLSKFQSRFRPKHSTVTALIQMCDKWLENMDNGKLNIKKALDSINHDILLNTGSNPVEAFSFSGFFFPIA